MNTRLVMPLFSMPVFHEGVPCIAYGDGPAVARWDCRNGNVVHLCQTCLDAWLDNADDEPDLEPAGWSWLAERQAA
jgi:hypothetical protein